MYVIRTTIYLASTIWPVIYAGNPFVGICEGGGGLAWKADPNLVAIGPCVTDDVQVRPTPVLSLPSVPSHHTRLCKEK